MKVRITLTGTAPLLVHNIRLANPLDPIAKAMKTVSSKRVKTEDDHEELARLEFVGGLYFDETLGPYLPGENIERSLIDGARITRAGRQLERGLFITDDVVPLLYKGPRTVDGLWSDAAFRSVLAVKVGAKARVMRTRPMFSDWRLEADGELDPALLSIDELQAIASTAGAMTGVGDYRPRYGRFTATVERL